MCSRTGLQTQACGLPAQCSSSLIPATSNEVTLTEKGNGHLSIFFLNFMHPFFFLSTNEHVLKIYLMADTALNSGNYKLNSAWVCPWQACDLVFMLPKRAQQAHGFDLCEPVRSPRSVLVGVCLLSPVSWRVRVVWECFLEEELATCTC